MVRNTTAQSTNWSEALGGIEYAIEQAMVEGQIPSMTLALVVGEEVVWSKGYGYANIWARTPAVPSTVYLIGSTFKAMSTVALLQHMEDGKFGLDDPVNGYLEGIRIKNEDADAPVTFRHLLTHTSGLPGDFGPFPVWGDDRPPSLEQYLATSLRAESSPMAGVVYSNMAYSLVGYLSGQFAGVPFRNYVQQTIFSPLEMNSTAFQPTPVMTERLAVPYVVDRASKRLVPTEQLKASVWPAGIVYGTVLDQANWLIANLNGGTFKGRHLLAEELMDQMHSLQYEAFKGTISGLWGGEEAGYGLTWWTDIRKGERFFAHSGSVPGYTAFLQGNKDKKIGIAILSNGNRAHRHLIGLADRIMALAGEVEEMAPAAAGN
ncbi:MAG: serine hydrolase domain-containing protein [Bacteroidota bacterium]